MMALVRPPGQLCSTLQCGGRALPASCGGGGWWVCWFNCGKYCSVGGGRCLPHADGVVCYSASPVPEREASVSEPLGRARCRCGGDYCGTHLRGDSHQHSISTGDYFDFRCLRCDALLFLPCGDGTGSFCHRRKSMRLPVGYTAIRRRRALAVP